MSAVTARQPAFGPLAGLRFIDLTVALAGSYTMMLLADLGAEVIKVESLRHYSEPTRGPRDFPPDPPVSVTRSYPGLDPSTDPWNRWSSFNSHGRNKRSVTMDLTRPEGRELFGQLIRISDGLIENNRPGQLEKLHLDPATMLAINDRLIIVRMPAIGLVGPDADTRGFGWHFEEFAGVLEVQGYPNGPSVGSVFMDAASGPSGASAVLMGLIQRTRTGKGQVIELAQMENLINHIGEVTTEAAMTGRVPPRRGNRDAVFAPQGMYRCRGEDEWIALSIRTDDEWRRLGDLAGWPAALADPGFATAAGRHRGHDEIDAALTAWTEQRDKHELFHLLQRNGIAAGPVLTEADIAADPQLAARGYYQVLAHPSAGEHPHAGPNFKLTATPLRMWRAAPTLGQDNEYVYRELLGVSAERYAELAADGHIGESYPS